MLAAHLVATSKNIGRKDPEHPSKDNIAVLTLNDKGMIRECNQAVGTLFGCRPSNLIWQHISVLLPQLAETPLITGGTINPRLRFLSRIGHPFEVVRMDGARVASELFFNTTENRGRKQLRVIISPNKAKHHQTA